MTILIEPDDLRVLRGTNNAEMFASKGFQWPSPEEALEIRNGPVVGEFWRERQIFGPFRPAPCPPQPGRPLDPEPRHRAQRLKRHYDEIRALCRD